MFINSRYVDDLAPGAQSRDAREGQEQDYMKLLSSICLKFKYIVRSGENPCEKASSDGQSVKLLGYKWYPENDTISPGFSELNLNPKVRGAKKPNLLPVVTREDALQLLESIQITKRIAVSKISELYDPVGIFEPIKLQYKLEMRLLAGMSWDKEIPDTDQRKWKEVIAGFVDLNKISVSRCSIPSDAESSSKIRLICLSDAAEYAGGAAVYGGWKLKDLGNRVGDIIFVTDSTIALCWVQNENKRLRIFVLNRVETIRRMINWTTEDDTIPLYHIDGAMNLADLLTKHHQIGMEDVSSSSEWQDGKTWMKLDISEMPLKRYQDLTVPLSLEAQVRAECYDHLLDPQHNESRQSHEIFSIFRNEVFVNSTAMGRGKNYIIIDPIYYGWFKSIRIIQHILSFIGAINHRRNHILSNFNWHICSNCQVPEKDAEDVMSRYETSTKKQSLKPEKLTQFKEHQGILYYQSRITEENPFRTEDLDDVPFLDIHEFTGKVPVLLLDSPVLYSYLMAIHTKILPHAGVEMTMKVLTKKFKVQGNVRGLIKRIKKDCSKCLLMLKKTVELEMSTHPGARTILAPPFYSTMLDIAYGFSDQPFKRSRKTIFSYSLHHVRSYQHNGLGGY